MSPIDGDKEEYTIVWGTTEPVRDTARTQQIREDNKSMLSLLTSLDDVGLKDDLARSRA